MPWPLGRFSWEIGEESKLFTNVTDNSCALYPIQQSCVIEPAFSLQKRSLQRGTLFLFSRFAVMDACIISIDLPLGTYGGGYPAWKRPFYRSFASNNQEMQLIRADSHAAATR
jgi:hypothetical protein